MIYCFINKSNIIGEKMEDKKYSDFLKLIAIITMLIDHIGAFLFPEFIILRIIGRLSFPIFAYFISEGYKHTSNIKRYMGRILLLGIVSQIPFMLLAETKTLNICFTFLISVGIIYFIDTDRPQLALPLLILGIILPVDYYIYGITLPIIFYMFKKPYSYLTFAISTFTFAIYNVMHNSSNIYYIFLFAVLTIPLFMLNDKLPYIKLPKYSLYYFYFGHLVIGLIIKYFLTGISFSLF